MASDDCDPCNSGPPTIESLSFNGETFIPDESGNVELGCDDTTPAPDPVVEDCERATKRLCPPVLNTAGEEVELLDSAGDPIPWFVTATHPDTGKCCWAINADAISALAGADCCIGGTVAEYEFFGQIDGNLGDAEAGTVSEYPGSLQITTTCSTPVTIVGSHDTNYLNLNIDSSTQLIEWMSPTLTGGVWEWTGIGNSSVCCPGDTREPISFCVVVPAGTHDINFRVSVLQTFPAGLSYGPLAYSQMTACASVPELVCQ